MIETEHFGSSSLPSQLVRISTVATTSISTTALTGPAASTSSERRISGTIWADAVDSPSTHPCFVAVRSLLDTFIALASIDVRAGRDVDNKKDTDFDRGEVRLEPFDILVKTQSFRFTLMLFPYLNLGPLIMLRFEKQQNPEMLETVSCKVGPQKIRKMNLDKDSKGAYIINTKFLFDRAES